MQTAMGSSLIADLNPLKAAYQALQWMKNGLALAHKNSAAQVKKTLFPQYPPLSVHSLEPETLSYLQQRYQALLDQDWADANAGVYPVELLFDTPWHEVLQFYPKVWLDLPDTWRRAHSKNYQEFSEEVDTSGYPNYYLQNFHYQTNGYLSDTSAQLYDLQVEILFGGMADPMRRRILPLLKRGLAQMGGQTMRSPKILDMACGTGRTLSHLRATWPQAQLFGVDLSPAYLQKAKSLLQEQAGKMPELQQANVESLPYASDSFDAVTSVFLFHELPAAARQNAINDCFRVLKPGGVLIICDSIQLSDSSPLAPMMSNFDLYFHEPYYKHYIHDDLTQRLENAGFESVATEVHFLSKYWSARKPELNSDAASELPPMAAI